MTDYSEFQFNPASLATPRKHGISAYMRIKNEEQFIRLAIESHLPFYDEIVAVYNDCSDNTEAILRGLQQQHPNKIRVFHYLPKVHSVYTDAHRNTPTESVHSMANYCNYAQLQRGNQIRRRPPRHRTELNPTNQNHSGRYSCW